MDKSLAELRFDHHSMQLASEWRVGNACLLCTAGLAKDRRLVSARILKTRHKVCVQQMSLGRNFGCTGI